MPVVPALGRSRQEDRKFETSLISIFYEILILLHVALLLCIHDTFSNVYILFTLTLLILYKRKL